MSGFRLFQPILAGATLGDRAVACLGAMAGIAVTGLVSALATGHDPHAPFIAAPIGASAVIVFAIPASPLAQPWPVVGGNTLSPLCGIAMGWLIGEPVWVAGPAVALALLVMSLTRTLHPPGGAMALISVIGGPTVTKLGLSFAALPVLVNSLLLVTLAWLFHRMSGHSYPHVPAPSRAPAQLVALSMSDIDAALSEMHETFDISRDDLERLLEKAEAHAAARTKV